jgi:cyclic pyranopterin phosphate synthase
MARHFRGSGHIVRFIEFMDVGSSNGWKMDEVLPRPTSSRCIDAEMPLEPIDPNYRARSPSAGAIATAAARSASSRR